MTIFIHQNKIINQLVNNYEILLFFNFQIKHTINKQIIGNIERKIQKALPKPSNVFEKYFLIIYFSLLFNKMKNIEFLLYFLVTINFI